MQNRIRPWLYSAIALALFLSPATSKETGKDPFLWRIQGDKPSYLYGTIHVGCSTG